MQTGMLAWIMQGLAKWYGNPFDKGIQPQIATMNLPSSCSSTSAQALQSAGVPGRAGRAALPGDCQSLLPVGAGSKMGSTECFGAINCARMSSAEWLELPMPASRS